MDPTDDTDTYKNEHAVNPHFKLHGWINFMVHNHPGSNPERVQMETYKDLNYSIGMGKLNRVQLRPGLIKDLGCIQGNDAYMVYIV